MTLRSLFLFGLLVILIGNCYCNDIEDQEEDRCVADRCQNGGRCIQVSETFAKCECGIGFVGKYCEEHIVPAFNFLHYDPSYMHKNPKDVWGRRYETDAIRPLLTESTKTLTDVLQRLYYNLIQFNNLGAKKPAGQQSMGFFVAK